MRIEEVLKKLKGKYLEHVEICPGQHLIVVKRKNLLEVLRFLLENEKIQEAQLSTMVGSDERPLNGHFSVTYWISQNGEGENWILGVKCYLPPEDLWIPSLAKYHPGANWYEREVKDLLGISPKGHPDPRRLILPDDWPEGVYPLRKDFYYRNRPKRGFTEEDKYPFKQTPEGCEVEPFGPYHIALDEPAHFRLYVKGEEIVGCDYRGFYSHRGIEKIAESRMTYQQVCFIAERICGICGFTHSTAYCQAVENALGIEVPERAKYIRTILLEIERLHSHLLWIGVAAHLLGFDTGFMHAWRIRERIMWLAEELTGNRKTYGINLVGGVRRDINEEKREKILKVCSELKKDYKWLVDFLTSNRTFVKRCEGVGVLSHDLAKKYSVTGPVARASGRSFDVRRDHPYAAYPEVEFEVPVYTEGDVLARFKVRAEEVTEAISIIEQALEEIPGGEILAEYENVPEYREGIGETEAPRGENVHYVMTSPEARVYRFRARAATYNNLPAIPEMLKGYTIADAPLIVASIDPCYSCTERVEIVDDEGKIKILSELEFQELCRRGSDW